jgi:hypothetical protein
MRTGLGREEKGINIPLDGILGFICITGRDGIAYSSENGIFMDLFLQLVVLVTLVWTSQIECQALRLLTPGLKAISSMT